MNFDTIDAALNALMEDFKYAYASNLIQSGHTATGNLALNQRHHFVFDGRYYRIYLELEPYWKYLENGTKPHFPPVDKIAEWIRIKPVLPRPNSKTGKIPTQKQLAFLIARSISVKGTRPTHTLQQTMDEFQLRNKVKKIFIDSIKKQVIDNQ